MAKRVKRTSFAIEGFDARHYRLTESYAKAVERLYDKATYDISKIAADLKVKKDKTFTFDDFPTAKLEVQKIVAKLSADVTYLIKQGSQKQWLFACEKGDKFLNSIMDTSKLSKARLQKYQDRNLDALKAFQERKTEGLQISDRVWKYAKQYNDQIETAIDVGIGEGRSAQQLSRDVRQNLKEPNKLFRRVRNKYGNLVLSKNAKAFSPGQGIYRSSYKNAMRLTRTEINMAYREADWLRWQQLDFVVGYEIRRSNHEPKFKCKVCERLKGKYPKWFKFKGWHPQCMCYVVPILMDNETYNKKELSDLRSALHGKPYNKFTAKNQVDELPDEFKSWMSENMQQQKNWRSTPFFVKDNFVDGDLSKGLMYVQSKPLTLLEKAEIRHRQRTQEQEKAIQQRWDERKKKHAIIRKAANNILNVAKDYSEVDYSALQSVVDAGDLNKMQAITREVAKAVSDMRKQERSLSNIIPNIHEWHKQFSLDELKAVYAGVDRTLNSMTSDLGGRKAKLAFEIEWVEKHKKYSTWRVAQSAYKKELQRVERRIEEREITDDVTKALMIASTSRSGSFKALADEMRSILETPNFDLDKARAKANELIKKQIEIEARRRGGIKEAKIGASEPLKRETFDELTQRLGNGLPKTLPNLDKAIKKYERTSRYGKVAKTHKSEIEALMRKVFDKHDFGMNIDEDVIEKVLTSWFKNTFEVGGGNGYVGSDKTTGKIETYHGRLRAAHNLFGLSNKLDADQLERSQYEKYGNLLDHNILDSLHKNTARQYGNVEVRFKKNKVLTTWTAGDSLGERWQPSLCSDPKACSFDDYYGTPTTRKEDVSDLSQFKQKHIASYLELQYHGKLTVDCVESLAFPYDLTNPQRATEYAIALKWKRIGVKVYFITDDGKLGKL